MHTKIISYKKIQKHQEKLTEIFSFENVMWSNMELIAILIKNFIYENKINALLMELEGKKEIATDLDLLVIKLLKIYNSTFNGKYTLNYN